MKDPRGRSPELLALRNGHNELAKWLASKLGHEQTSDEREASNDGCATKANWYTHGEKVIFSQGLSEALEIMIQYGNLESIRRLYELGPPSTAYLYCGLCSPLLFALLWKQQAIANYLLDMKVSLEGRCCRSHAGTHWNCNVCHLTARAPPLDGILRRIVGTPAFPIALTNEQDTYGVTPLHEAAGCGNLEAVKVILEYGGRVDIYDERLGTPLHAAAVHGNASVLRRLLSAGSNPNVFTHRLRTPAWLAASNGNYCALKVLHGSGANLATCDVHLDSPLQIAARNGHLKIVSFLLYEGRQLGCCDNSESSVLRALLESPHPPVITLGLHSGLLLDEHALLWYHVAAPRRILKHILRRYVQENLIRDINRRHMHAHTTPLYHAAAASQVDTATVLIETGALMNLEGGQYGTPVMAVCTYGRLAMVMVLARMGAMLSYKKNGVVFSAINAASNHPNIVPWLLVERFTQAKFLCTASNGSQARTAECVNQQVVFQRTGSLCLDLVLAEEFDEYLKTRSHAPVRVFICHMEGNNIITVEAGATAGSTNFVVS